MQTTAPLTPGRFAAPAVALVLLALFIAAGAHAQSRPSGVPSGSVQYKEHWYKVVNPSGNLSWREAIEEAKSAGGHLVCIESNAEREFVNGLIENQPNQSFWIGGFKHERSGRWLWINGRSIKESMILSPGRSNPDLRLRILPVPADRDWQPLPIASTARTGGYIVEYPSDAEFAHTLPENAPPPDDSNNSNNSPPEPEPSMDDGPKMAEVKITGNEHAKAIDLKKTQTRVKGLLVIPLGGDEHAGGASQMNLSAVAGAPEESATIGFNQPVGETMASALKEVVKFIELRHDGWPKGRALEIAFEDKYSGKDGPSAAVACALLLDSAISGNELESQFAVTGDLNADGSVQPIGGVRAKIRGATNRDCTHVAVPDTNATDVSDLVLTDGFRSISEIQVFSISNFDEAHALASQTRPENIQNAMETFRSIQDVYKRRPDNFLPTLKHPKMIEKLNEVLAAAPNHLSASIMLSHGLGEAPKTLSLQGSVAFIDTTAFKMVDVIEDGKVAEIDTFDDQHVANAIRELQRMRTRLDKRTWKWADDLITFGKHLHQYQTNRPKSVTNHNKLVAAINEAGDRARAERKTLMSNKEVVEELVF